MALNPDYNTPTDSDGNGAGTGTGTDGNSGTTPPDTSPNPVTADGLPANLFTWLGDTTGRNTTLAMYQKYNNAVTLDPVTGLLSVSFGMGATAEKEDLLLMMEQVIQWNANNTPTAVTTRIDTIKTKLNKAASTDGVYDAWELAILWVISVNPALFAPVSFSDSLLNTYVTLAVEKNGGTLATRIQSDYLRTKDPNAPLPNPQPGADTNDPNPVPMGGTTPVYNTKLVPWIIAVVVAILILLALKYR